MKKLLLWTTAALSVIALPGCVDDNYDLSDIDTTSRLEVRDLVLPLNVDAVTLSDLMDLDDDSKIKVVNINGKDCYALVDEGSFDSDPIFIDEVKAAAPTLSPSQQMISLISEEVPTKAAPTVFTYQIAPTGNDFTYNAMDIDSSIESIKDITVEPMKFTVTFELPGLADLVDGLELLDIRLQMPKGLTATSSIGDYDSASGIWSLPSLAVAGSSATAALTCTKIDLQANDAVIKNRHLEFNSSFRIISGYVGVTPKTSVTPPANITFKASYKLSDIIATAVSGRISYALDGINIDPFALTDIPDFLNGDETEIRIANPQIYLSVNNPVQSSNLKCTAGLELTAIRNGENPYVLPDTPTLTIGTNSASDIYNYAVAPSRLDLANPAGFDSPAPTFVSFPSLGTLLAAPGWSAKKGLPDQIGIRVINAGIPSQDVVDFRLGRTLESLAGKYELIAPLALEAGSVIVYSDKETGWSDDELNDLTITSLTLSAMAVNTLPLEAEVTVTPIDMDGNPIFNSLTGEPVVFTSNHLDANTTTPQELKFELKGGTISNLDGVIYRAYVKSKGADALAPSMTINLKDIRVKVSGYYQKEF